MTPEQQGAFAELLQQLQGAFVIKARPPAAMLTDAVRLADLVDQAQAALPEKYRAVVLKLERQIRQQLTRELEIALDVAAQLGADLPPDHPGAQIGRWAYQAGLVVGAVMHFSGQPPAKPKPTPPPGGRVPRENR